MIGYLTPEQMAVAFQTSVGALYNWLRERGIGPDTMAPNGRGSLYSMATVARIARLRAAQNGRGRKSHVASAQATLLAAESVCGQVSPEASLSAVEKQGLLLGRAMARVMFGQE